MMRLPPLNALRAFEATARHLSVKNAADELCVTPGAVSQMLKSLELHLGVTLFRRVNRGIFLTDAGQGYLPPIRNAFRQITEATKRLAMSLDTGILTVSVAPFFATAWLVPRLKEFQDAHPDLMADRRAAFLRTDGDVFRAACGALAELDLRPELVKVQVPVLVLVGEHDEATPPPMSHELAAGLPNAQLKIIAGCAHVPQLQAPQMFLDAIGDFLAG